MDKKLKQQINKFLDKSQFINSTVRTNHDGEVSRFRFVRDRNKSRELPTGLSFVSKQMKNNSSYTTSKQTSMNNSYLNSLGNTMSKSAIESRKNIVSLRKHQSFSRNKRPPLFKQQNQVEQELLKKLYKAKIVDLEIDSNPNTEKAFIIRMQLGLTTKKLNCGDLGIGKTSLIIIQKHLILENTINTLILDNSYFNLQCFNLVSKIIKQSNIVKLSLVSTNMSSQTCKIILHSIQESTHLCDLNLSSKDGLYRNKLGASGLKPFQTLFGKVPTLHMVNLDGSSISEDGFKSICCGLENNGSLYGLQVARNLISENLFKEQGIKLSYCQIAVLDLTGNNIGDKGMSLLGDLLGKSYAYNTISVRLKSLNVSQNNITVIGIEEFSKKMVLNSTLEQLIFDNNKISKTGYSLQSFKLLINQNFSINNLSAKKISIETIDTILLFEGIERNNSILTLNLSDNILDDLAVRSLGLVFKNNECLKIVSLRSCSIMDKSFVYISEGIKRNSVLEKLYLDKNFLKDESADLIQRFLVARRNIVVVTWEKNLISVQQSKQITRILADNAFISSGKVELTSFHKKQENNKNKMQRLRQEISELSEKLQIGREKAAEENLIITLIEIDEIQKKIQREKNKISELQKHSTFVTE